MNSISQFTRTALATLLMTGAPLSLVYVLAVVYWRALLGPSAPGALLNLPYPVYSTVCLLGWVHFFMIAGFFPAWLFDISKRVTSKCYLPLPFTPAKAAMAFFIPVQQVCLPYYVMNSLCFRAQQRGTSNNLLRFWWASWLLMFTGAMRILFVAGDLEQFWLYGSATLFCVLSLFVMFVLESSLQDKSRHVDSLHRWPLEQNPSSSRTTVIGLESKVSAVLSPFVRWSRTRLHPMCRWMHWFADAWPV